MALQLETEDMRGLTDDQKVAIMEALVLGILADGRVAQPEIEKFENEAARIPWGMSDEQVKSKMTAARDRLVGLVRAREEAPIVASIQSIAKRVTTPALRDKVFRTMTAVMGAGDGLTLGEKNLMIVVANAFEMSPDRLDKIKAEMIASGE